jgi:hypothetical protein
MKFLIQEPTGEDPNPGTSKYETGPQLSELLIMAVHLCASHLEIEIYEM